MNPENAPWIIAELRAMEEGLVALETDTIDAEVKRLVKVSHIAATIGRVMWVWFRHQWKAEEEEWSG
jgi:hypothetical protein